MLRWTIFTPRARSGAKISSSTQGFSALAPMSTSGDSSPAGIFASLWPIQAASRGNMPLYTAGRVHALTRHDPSPSRRRIMAPAQASPVRPMA
jgi:hypothetical protein